jgi:phage terminase small subunit
MGDMTPRQHRFVREYLVDRNGAGAAVRAGYSRRTARQIAHELLAKAPVAAAVADSEARIAADTEISRQRVIAGLREAVDHARERQDAMAMIRAWAEIGKLMGYYAPVRSQVELSTAHGALRTAYEAMSDAELIEVIERG